MTPAPLLEPHQLLVLLAGLASLLLAALCLGRLATRLGMPAVVGELLAGVVLGPSVLGYLIPAGHRWLFSDGHQMHLLDGVAQVGALLFVGVVGAHLDLGWLRRRVGCAASVSLGGLLVPMALGIGAGYLVAGTLLPEPPDRLIFALFLGVAMCVSSIPVIAKTLADLRLLHRDVGQLTLAAGMVDDAIAWVLLSVVTALATAGRYASAATRSVLVLVGFVAIAVLVRPLVQRALERARRSDEPGLALTVVVLVVLAGALAAQALGLEAVFGAFIAGVLVGSPGAGYSGSAWLAPLRTVVMSVLAPVFLATAGLRIDAGLLAHRQALLAAAVLLLVAVLGKVAGAYAGARIGRLGHWEGLALGAGMNARGILQIIVAMVGLRLGVLDATTYTIIVLVAILTSLMAPPLLRWAVARIDRGPAQQRPQADSSPAPND